MEGILAYNLCEYIKSTKGREKLEEILKGIPLGSYILIIAGEIDCRVHLLRQAKLQNKSLLEIADDLVIRYLDFLSTLTNKYRIMILLPPPSSFLDENKDDKQYPRYGSEFERNKITEIVKEKMKSYSKKTNILYIDVPNCINNLGYTNKKYLWVGIHYSTYALPYLVKDINSKLKIRLRIPLLWWSKEIIRRSRDLTIKIYNTMVLLKKSHR